ncbi:MAG: glycoside hydrolase [Acidobacteriia bacterium]|nr:glycoside hydrolase [Terriglobia bacterium]
MIIIRRLAAIAAVLIGVALSTIGAAQQFPSGLFHEIKWRNLGPHRASRTKAAAGVAGQPNIFYIGVVNGGVWKTDDYGRTWTPIFDDQPTGSIGAIAVAPSDPNVVYVGSGEGLQRPDLSTGDGIYKSTDAGRTWIHLGLRDGQQIPEIIVDPRDANRLFVAVLGHPYGPNEERGVFRSTDGGRTFQKVLYRDADTGASDLAFDPVNPDILYAALWESRQGPWENAAWNGPGSGLYKSSDGGDSWLPLTKGLPTFAEGLGRIGVGVAPSAPNRLYATVEVRGQGYVYRSDDAGESWYRTSSDTRIATRPSDAAEIAVDPKNPDIVYSVTIVTWKSVDGGKSWSAFRGAPGGDDYQKIWINPNNANTILLTSDQGAIITVNGGRTWSSWYNQPTAALYHVTTDNAFPYRVCSGQQESGSVCISSRGDDGQVTFREWQPVGVDEYGYVAPDPLDPDIVYGGRTPTRYDRRTGQAQNIAPEPVRAANFRVLRTAPILFSPIDPHTLYFASNTLWMTTSGGRSWANISPDLTRKMWEIPANVGKYRDSESARPVQRGVIYTIAPSYVDIHTIWAGTDDGLIHVTHDGGKTWQDVTPPDLKPWMKVSLMDAGHSDAATAYAAINTFKLDDLRPHIYRTHDGGKTWTHITGGIPGGGIINVVREDPKRKGLLFSGSEQAVYVSFDDGDHWQSLRLNMPATSIRDLVIKDDDLVVATHGRSFWILDDITPLRQIDQKALDADALLFQPQEAWRFRWNKNTDTPLPPDEPAGQNPPDGAIIHYYLKARAAGPVTLEILDGAGKLVRKFSSADKPDPIADIGNVPRYWIRPSQTLSADAGLHRFVWDLHYAPPPVASFSYPISAIFQNTWREPRGPWAHPGRYTARLTVNGKSLTHPLTVKMDPRVTTPAAGLLQQFTLSMRLYEGIQRNADALAELRKLRVDLAARRARTTGDAAQAIDVLEKKLAAIEGTAGGEFGGTGTGGEPGLAALSGQLLSALDILQEADAAPTPQAAVAVESLLKDLSILLARWDAAKK